MPTLKRCLAIVVSALAVVLALAVPTAHATDRRCPPVDADVPHRLPPWCTPKGTTPPGSTPGTTPKTTPKTTPVPVDESGDEADAPPARPVTATPRFTG